MTAARPAARPTTTATSASLTRAAATERLLGPSHDVRRRQVSEAAGVSLLSARRFWHALGFPALGDADMAFAQADVAALGQVEALTRDGIDESMALAMTRAMARTAERLAEWHVGLVTEAVLDEGLDPRAEAGADDGSWRERLTPEVGRRVGELMLATADDLEPLVVYAWRRHLAAAVGRLVEGDDAGAEAGPGRDRVRRSVGFADLVGFTSLVSRLSERRLASLVQRFEELATDVVTAHGGRVVKTLGDEVVFTAPGPGPAAAIALDLVEAVAESDDMPGLRAGVATGPVVAQLGDVFGPTVNRASRISVVASPDTVLIDDATATDLTSRSGFEMRPLPPRALRGLGLVRSWELRRTAVPTRRGPVTGGEDWSRRGGGGAAPGAPAYLHDLDPHGRDPDGHDPAGRDPHDRDLRGCDPHDIHRRDADPHHPDPTSGRP